MNGSGIGWILGVALGCAAIGAPRPASAAETIARVRPVSIEGLVARGDAALAAGDTLAAANAYRRAYELVREGDEHRVARAKIAVKIGRTALVQSELDGNADALADAIAILEDAEWESTWKGTSPHDAAVHAELVELRSRASSLASAPVAAPAPAHADVAPGILVRATIDADPLLRKRWRRGSALLGVGVPIAVAAGAMFAVGGFVVAADTVFSERPDRATVAVFWSGLAALPVAATMIGLGIRDRVFAKRAARRQLELTALPRRDGATLGLAFRF